MVGRRVSMLAGDSNSVQRVVGAFSSWYRPAALVSGWSKTDMAVLESAGRASSAVGLVRLLQVSDLHLGRPFGWLPTERREERRREQRQALERCVTEAIERGAHAILVAGDLFDEEGVDADTLAFALEAFHLTGCPPVFIAPGNHDPYSPRSLFWNPQLLRARGRQWPEHVTIFTDTRWKAEALNDEVRVWGRCYVSKTSDTERPLTAKALTEVKVEKQRVEIALFHGSREGHVPPGQTTVAPFSDQEALASPFTYLAAGHYHAAGRLAAPQGPVAGVRLAYAGSAIALDTTESGAHGALEVRIEYGLRQPFVEIEFVPLDTRQAFDLEVDVTGCSSAERVDRRIEKALGEASVGERDIVTVRLTGRIARDVRYEPSRDLLKRAFHLKLDRRKVRPDYPLDSYRERAANTTDERFARVMLERIEAAKDPGEKAKLERALYYGLDAFQLREVVPAHEELE
jgi:exonuclease SbcD